MLALYCLYSGGVSGWAGGAHTLYWRVETTVRGRGVGGRRGDTEGDADKAGRQTKENRKEKKREKNEKQPSQDEKIKNQEHNSKN